MHFILCKVIFVRFTSSPFSLTQKVSPLLNPKLCFVVEGSRKVVHFGAEFRFALLQNSSNGQFGLFSPPPTHHACQVVGT